jgi:hypothetical protein
MEHGERGDFIASSGIMVALILPEPSMLKWLIALFVTVSIASVVMPRLTTWLKLGRLPGDVHFRWRNRVYDLPFTSALLLSLLAGLILRFL